MVSCLGIARRFKPNRRYIRIAWIAGAVICLLIFSETWFAMTLMVQKDTYKRMTSLQKHTNNHPVINITRESDGCLCIDEQTRQLRQLAAGETSLTRAECPVAKNATLLPSEYKSKQYTALASFPGSGNTWTRHLIEYISGILTGSVYIDKRLASAFKAETATPDQRQIAIKTHSHHEGDNITFDNVILLVRSPKEAIASLFNYLSAGSHIRNAESNVFNKTEWAGYVKGAPHGWKSFHLSYLNEYSGRMMLLSYSRLRNDFYTEVCKLGNFFNITISYETLWCASENREGKFHRKAALDYSSIYTQAQMDDIKRAEQDVKEEIVRRFGEDAVLGGF